MYAQFFGNYLLSHDLISKEQLLAAMEQKNTKRPKLGTIAMHAGYMSASEVEHIHILQTHQDRKFGELAIEVGILTPEQVDELLCAQVPDYLALGQALVDAHVIDNYELERLIIEYISENEIYDLDNAEDSKEKVEQLFRHYLAGNEDAEDNNVELMYCSLLFNNLVRFIGDDFTPVLGTRIIEYPKNFCVSQAISGKYNIKMFIDMPEETCIEFASRYVGEEFYDFDEYVEAAVADFANLHNGLFCVNVSNTDNIELLLDPPVTEDGMLLFFENTAFLIPIIYPFGTVNFIFEISVAE